jgi:hypothetical protein
MVCFTSIHLQLSEEFEDTKGVIRIHQSCSPKVLYEEQTTQWSKEKNTNGQTTIYKTNI